MRDGEPLALAIEDAQRKSRDARAKANEFIAEAEKWELVAADLLAAADKTRTPAASLKRFGAVAAEALVGGNLPTRPRRPRGFWGAAVVEVMRSLPEAVVGPTKSEVYRLLRARYPEESNHAVYVAVNQALSEGRIVARGNNVFLPEKDPQRKVA